VINEITEDMKNDEELDKTLLFHLQLLVYVRTTRFYVLKTGNLKCPCFSDSGDKRGRTFEI